MTQDRITHDPDGTIDEIVLRDAYVHLEHMGGDNYVLIVENDRAHFNLSVRNAQTIELLVDNEPIKVGTDWRAEP